MMTEQDLVILALASVFVIAAGIIVASIVKYAFWLVVRVLIKAYYFVMPNRSMADAGELKSGSANIVFKNLDEKPVKA